MGTIPRSFLEQQLRVKQQNSHSHLFCVESSVWQLVPRFDSQLDQARTLNYSQKQKEQGRADRLSDQTLGGWHVAEVRAGLT